MMWLWIGLGLFSLFLAWVFCGACRLGAQADERMWQAFEKRMESDSQNAADSLQKEVTDDGGGS